jgi:integrase
MARKNITDGLYQKSNGVWERIEIINGKRRSFSSKNPEKVWEKRNSALSEATDKIVEQDDGPLFETVCDEYEKSIEKMKYGTQRTYFPAVRRARKHFMGKRMREIEPYMISDFLKSFSGSARTTVSNQKTVINAVFQTWIDSPLWHGDANPAKLVSIPKGLKKTKRQPPTDEQVKIVKDHYMEPDALPAVLYLCTGERRGEACAIRLKDVDFENKTITINKSLEFRNNHPHLNDWTKTPAGERKIPLLNMLAEALEPMRNMNPDTYLISRSTKPLKWTQYDKLWTDFWKKYGYAHKIEKTEKQRQLLRMPCNQMES